MFWKKFLYLGLIIILILLILSAVSPDINEGINSLNSGAILSGSGDSIIIIFSGNVGSSGIDFIRNQSDSGQTANFWINGTGRLNNLQTNNIYLVPSLLDTPSPQIGHIRTIGSGDSFGAYIYDGSCWRSIQDWGCKGIDRIIDSYTNTSMIATADNLTINTTLGQISFIYPWLTGWSYRKKKTIIGSSGGEQTNYQMGIIRVLKANGTDSSSGANETTQNVYVGTNVRNDFGDVRFTKNDGNTILDYYMIGLSSGNYADFWVEVPNIPISPNTINIYIYYNNSSTTSINNKTNTFEFIDDFLGTTIDATKWNTTITNGAITVSDGLLTLTSTSTVGAMTVIETKNKYTINSTDKLVAEWFARPYSMDESQRAYELQCLYKITDDGTYTGMYSWNNSYRSYVAGNALTPATTSPYGSMKTYKTTMDGTQARFYVDGTEQANSPQTVSSNTYIYFGTHRADLGFPAMLVVDWVLARKFISPEPTWGATGIQETMTTGNLLSTNLFLNRSIVTSIDSLNYISNIPSGTSIKIQFSRDNSRWYDSSGTLDGWDTMTSGTHSLNLSGLHWAGPYFYYKAQFTTEGTNIPILDEISLNITAH